MFVDYLTDYLTDWMTSHRNIIICWDFNIHIDDTTEGLGLQQHVNFETHHAGDTLDLIFTEITSQPTMRTFKGRFRS